MTTINVKTTHSNQMIDITADVRKAIRDSDTSDGLCIVYTPHTTAAITINENADPDVVTDMIDGLNSLGFKNLSFRHMEGNSESHLKSSLIGCSEQVIIESGSPVLGTWQGIYFCEFDGPRTRKVFIKII
ncbi:MAG: secondary thiamine-phosphate synthase enzyme YjbQ [Spirochaetes bacterium]|jgi:secondary thiamine-phosphate synthase enzyme|nr:secondary thiamine-phosphate synthase enzyme YjbQ [Spirochaetota bacterium]